MADFGVTSNGFNIKGFDVILRESKNRAIQMFGDDVDLSPTSPLCKILEVTAAEDAELWKRMEDLYYSNFISTASGADLDRLGEDIGVERLYLFAEGTVTFALNNAEPGRTYVLPVKSFYTTEPVYLGGRTLTADVPARAYRRGPEQNIEARSIIGIDPVYQQFHLQLGGSVTVDATNLNKFTGGERMESDEAYRARLLGWPRTMWTKESVRRAVAAVDGVTDVLLFDPLGGVDVSQSYFNLFRFHERMFSRERSLGEPYFFDVIVAHDFVWPWRTQSNVEGVLERVTAAIEQVRPVGIHPNIIQADHIEVGMRARVVIERGYDPQAILASIKERVASDIRQLTLGSDVLYSQVMRAFVEQTGVVDVQNLHLRRYQAAFGRITFGAVPYQSGPIESAPGENLSMGATEIAVFRLDSELIEIEVTAR
jgi:phage-related baseplate assembly protein